MIAEFMSRAVAAFESDPELHVYEEWSPEAFGPFPLRDNLEFYPCIGFARDCSYCHEVNRPEAAGVPCNCGYCGAPLRRGCRSIGRRFLEALAGAIA